MTKSFSREEKKSISVSYDVLNELQLIYEDIEKRNNIECWKEVLEEYKFLLDTSDKGNLETYLFDFLSEHKDCSKEVYELFNMYAKWTKNEISLYDKYDEAIVKYILYRIKNDSYFNNDYIHMIPKDKLLKYLRLREEAFYDLQFAHKGNEALAKIYDVLYIYKDEHYMLNLQAEYLMNRGKIKEALEVVDKSLLIKPSKSNNARIIKKELRKKMFLSDKYRLKLCLSIYIIFRIVVFVLKEMKTY